MRGVIVAYLFCLVGWSLSQLQVPKTIDGNPADWLNSERFECFFIKTYCRILGAQSTPWFFSWDSTNFYFATDNAAVANNDAGLFILLHLSSAPVANISASPGTKTGTTFIDQTPSLAFPSDSYILWKGDNTFADVFRFNGMKKFLHNQQEASSPRLDLILPAQEVVRLLSFRSHEHLLHLRSKYWLLAAS